MPAVLHIIGSLLGCGAWWKILSHTSRFVLVYAGTKHMVSGREGGGTAAVARFLNMDQTAQDVCEMVHDCLTAALVTDLVEGVTKGGCGIARPITSSSSQAHFLMAPRLFSHSLAAFIAANMCSFQSSSAVSIVESFTLSFW